MLDRDGRGDALDFFDVGIRKVLAKRVISPEVFILRIVDRNDHRALGESECCFDGFDQTLTGVVLDHDAIDDGVDRVLFVAVEFEWVLGVFFKGFSERILLIREGDDPTETVKVKDKKDPDGESEFDVRVKRKQQQ